MAQFGDALCINLFKVKLKSLFSQKSYGLKHGQNKRK